MATIKIKHWVTRPAPASGLPRHFWQPSPGLRKLGWKPQRVPLDWHRYDDAGQLELAAIARVRELNEDADSSRIATALKATRPAPSPATP